MPIWRPVILETLEATPPSDQVTDQITDQVKSLLLAFDPAAEMTSDELLRRLGLRHKPTFRKNHLNPALASGLIEMTEPESPRSPTQRYHFGGERDPEPGGHPCNHPAIGVIYRP